MSKLRLEKYEIRSLGAAIFTLTSWPGNRRYLGVVDQLNRDFIAYEQTQVYGHKKIDNYQDFVRFYQSVKDQYTKGAFPPEPFLVDVGEVKFYSDNNHKYYQVVIGNGSEDTYESCYIVDKLVSLDNKFSNIWTGILEYENKLLNILYGDRIVDDRLESDLSCPTAEYYQNVCINYLDFQSNQLFEFFEQCRSVNDELYPFFTHQLHLAVFLPMMKEVFEEKLEQEYPTESLVRATTQTLQERIISNYTNHMNGVSDYLCSATISNDKGDAVLEDALVLFDKDRCVVIIVTDEPDVITHRIESELKDCDVEIEGKPSLELKAHVEVPKKIDVFYQLIVATDLSPNINKSSFSERGMRSWMRSTDAIAILNYASNIPEVVDFLMSYADPTSLNIDKMWLTSGVAGLFQTWHEQHKVLNEGASPLSLMVSTYIEADANIEFFAALSRSFPYDSGKEFLNPHHWYFPEESERTADLELNSKGNESHITVYSDRDNSIILCENESMLEDSQIEDLTVVQSFEEIIDRELKQHKKQILGKLNYRYLKIVISSKKLTEMQSKAALIESDYYSIGRNASGTVETLFVTPKWGKILEDNLVSEKRNFENSLLVDLVTVSDLNDKEILLEEIHQDDHARRTSGISTVEERYYIDPRIQFFSPSITAFHEARQIIASVVYKQQIKAGKYKDVESVKPLRLFSSELRMKLVELLRSFNVRSLLVVFMNWHAADLFQISLHKKRLKSFSDGNLLTEESQIAFRNKTIKLREEAKQYQGVMEYLIEASLMYGGNLSESDINENDKEKMIALAKWILDFQSVDDQVKSGAQNWITVSIQDNGVVDLLPTTHADTIGTQITQARYKFGDFDNRDEALDSKYFKEFEAAFQVDTGINFNVMECVIEFLASYGVVEELKRQHKVTVIGNVVEASMNDLAMEFDLQTTLNAEDFYQVIKFLCLDSSSLIDKSGLIPTWEKKRRTNKYVAKPILFFNNRIVYEPVNLNNTLFNWSVGAYNFTLPYQLNMARSKSMLDRWKKEYENIIVQNIEALFSPDRFITHVNKELYKLDKEGRHPRNLGDYDVIAIDSQRHEVWIIEVKYLRLDQTASENIESQSEYFLDKKAKGEKFLKRVNYFEAHVDDIMHNIGFHGHFTVRPYFVANKIVRSQFKEYPFSILGFNEFRGILELQ